MHVGAAAPGEARGRNVQRERGPAVFAQQQLFSAGVGGIAGILVIHAQHGPVSRRHGKRQRFRRAALHMHVAGFLRPEVRDLVPPAADGGRICLKERLNRGVVEVFDVARRHLIAAGGPGHARRPRDVRFHGEDVRLRGRLVLVIVRRIGRQADAAGQAAA